MPPGMPKSVVVGGSILEFVRGWLDDPQASSGLFIALVAAIFAIYQLRSFPAERRRRVLDAMIQKYSDSSDPRTTVLRKFPPLFAMGYDAVSNALIADIVAREAARSAMQPDAAAIAGVALQHLDDIRRQLELWHKPSIGLSYMSAAEIVNSEAKLRVLLFAISRIRAEPSSAEAIDPTVLTAARKAVNSLNDFATEYENGGFPAREMYGLLHRSIGSVTKALEPIIWAESPNGRWGRRVLRLGIGSQHFNDVSGLHRTSDMSWSTAAADNVTSVRYVVHPARTIDVLGREQPDMRVPGEPRFLPIFRLRMRQLYWRWIGVLAFKPKRFIFTFGGSRLRRHAKAEGKLVTILRFIRDSQHAPGAYGALNFGWTLEGVKGAIDAAARQGVSGQGRFSWLWARKPV